MTSLEEALTPEERALVSDPAAAAWVDRLAANLRDLTAEYVTALDAQSRGGSREAVRLARANAARIRDLSRAEVRGLLASAIELLAGYVLRDRASRPSALDPAVELAERYAAQVEAEETEH